MSQMSDDTTYGKALQVHKSKACSSAGTALYRLRARTVMLQALFSMSETDWSSRLSRM